MIDLVISGLKRLAIFVGGSITLVVLYGLYNLFIHPLRKYPGPLLWRAYRVPYTLVTLRGDLPFVALDLHKKYGPVVRVAPTELSYATPSAWKSINGARNPAVDGVSEFVKDRLVFQKPPNGVYSIISADTADHGRYRRLMSYAFSEKGMREMQGRIEAVVNQFIDGLKEECSEAKLRKKDPWLDILAWYNWTTFDIIGDLAFGESFHCLEERKTSPWIEFIFGNVKSSTFLGAIRQYGLERFIPYLTPKKVAKARLANNLYSQEMVNQRIAQGPGRGDFWDTVLAKSNFEKGTGMTRDEMVSNASLLVLAGSETTATTLSGTTYLLLKHPEKMKKLVQEIRSSFQSEDEINLTNVNKLEYMLAVLDEAMRLYPPVPGQGQRVIPKPGAMISGKWVPGGTSLQVARYAITRLEEYFTRPDEFIPERWLSDAPTEFAKDDRTAPQSFSTGPRNCIGRNLAYAEMRLVLAKVCWNFDIELDEGRSGNWIDQQKVFFLWEKKPLWVKLRPFRR